MKASAGRALARAVPFLILVLLLGGCAAYHRWRSRPAPPYPKMTPGVAYEIMRDNPGMMVLDLRPAVEYNGRTGHIRGAQNIPLNRLPYRLGGIYTLRDETILVYCGTRECGEQGMRLLRASGFDATILLEGGIEKWIQGGFKTVLPANLVGGRGAERTGEDTRPTQPARPPEKKPNPRPEVEVKPPPPPG
jgi:rhodanese-related sulfurtransferase